MAGQEEEILELVQIEFRDLLEASEASKKPSAASIHQKNVIMEALGPHGPGLLSVTGIRDLEDLRRSLLPLARKLAFMDDATRRAVLKISEKYDIFPTYVGYVPDEMGTFQI